MTKQSENTTIMHAPVNLLACMLVYVHAIARDCMHLREQYAKCCTENK